MSKRTAIERVIGIASRVRSAASRRLSQKGAATTRDHGHGRWIARRRGGVIESLITRCATHLLQGGADVRHVQKLLGHASLQSTAVYTRVFPKDLALAMKKAHPRERTWARRQRQ